MFNLIDFLSNAGKKVQERVGNTPILPFIPLITPNSMAKVEVPLEKQVEQMNPILRKALGPITQAPSFIGENIRQIGRFAGLKPNTMDIATAPLMFMGGVKPKTKLGINQIDDAIDTVRGNLGSADDQIMALRDIEKFAKENLTPKELKSASKSSVDLIESIIGKFTDPVDVTKGRLGDVPSTGGEINPLIQEARKYKSAEEFMKTQGEVLYHHGATNLDSRGNTWFTNNKFGAGGARSGASGKSEVVIDKSLKFANEKQATKAGLYSAGDSGKTASKVLSEQGFDGIKRTVDGDTHYLVFDGSKFKTKSQLTDMWNKAQGSGEIGKGVSKKR